MHKHIIIAGNSLTAVKDYSYVGFLVDLEYVPYIYHSFSGLHNWKLFFSHKNIKKETIYIYMYHSLPAMGAILH